VVPFWKTQPQPVGLVPNWEITQHEIWGALRVPRDLVVQGIPAMPVTENPART